MTTQTEAQRLAAKMKSYKLTSGYAWHCHKAGDELLRLDRIEHAWQMWQDKTEWVQKTSEGHELGMHRADALRQRIERLEAANAELLEALKKISAIELQMYGPDWAEIQSAQDVANEAIKKHGGAA